jgi:hypothetical protein
MKVGTVVTHKEYPAELGRIVGKFKESDQGGTSIYLVKWDQTKECSRHIGSALKLAFKKL